MQDNLHLLNNMQYVKCKLNIFKYLDIHIRICIKYNTSDERNKYLLCQSVYNYI